MKICIKKTRSGRRCKASALAGSSYCFFHDQKTAQLRALGRRQGGFNSHRSRASLPFPNCKIKTLSGLIDFMDVLIRDTWALGPSTSRARALCQLSGHLGELVKLRDAERQQRRRDLEHEEELLQRDLELARIQLGIPKYDPTGDPEGDLVAIESLAKSWSGPRS